MARKTSFYYSFLVLPAAQRVVVAVSPFDFSALYSKKRYEEKSDLGRFAARECDV